MKIAPLAGVKARLSAFLEQCQTNGPVVITRNGKAVAVLLAPRDDDDLESLILSRSPRFQALLNKSRQSIKAGQGLSRSKFWKVVAERNKKRGGARRVSNREG
jgi:prevent-host-death family protein